MGTKYDILILEDDPSVALMLGHLLGSFHRVRVARTAAAALALIGERLPDVILSDFDLGHDTAEAFLRDVKSRWPRLRCVLHSGARPEQWQGLLRDRVIDDVVPKPASCAELLIALKAA